MQADVRPAVIVVPQPGAQRSPPVARLSGRCPLDAEQDCWVAYQGRYRAVSSGHTARYGPGRRRRGTPPRSPSLTGKPGGLVPGRRCGPEHIDAHSAQGTPFSGTRCGNGFRREHGPVGRHNDGLTADAIGRGAHGAAGARRAITLASIRPSTSPSRCRRISSGRTSRGSSPLSRRKCGLVGRPRPA